MKTVFEEFKTHYTRKHVITNYPGVDEPVTGKMQVSTSFRAAYDEEHGVLAIDSSAYTCFRAPSDGPGCGRYIAADPQPPEQERILVTVKDPAAMMRYVIAKADQLYNVIIGWCAVMGDELHHVIPMVEPEAK